MEFFLSKKYNIRVYITGRPTAKLVRSDRDEKTIIIKKNKRSEQSKDLPPPNQTFKIEPLRSSHFPIIDTAPKYQRLKYQRLKYQRLK